MGIFDFMRRTDTTVYAKSNIPVTRHKPRNYRHYTAASDEAFMGGFADYSGSADYVLTSTLTKLRNRCRFLIRNSGTGKRYRRLLMDNIVGAAGFSLQVKVRKADGTLDRSLNKRAVAVWKEFCEAPTTDQVSDMIDLENLMVAAWASDGEFFAEVVTGNRYRFGVAFHPIEADLIDEGLNTVHPATGNQIKLGVEIDQYNRPVAYHVLNQHPGDTSVWFHASNRKRYRRVPAERIIHVYERLRAGQTRGEPPMSATVRGVRMLDGYREAEVTGRRVKSSSMGFVLESETATPNDQLDGLADDPQSDDDAVPLEMTMKPGTITKLPRGMDFKQFDPGGAMTDYAQFEGQIKADNSMGLNISPVSLGYETAKLSYSTHRGVIQDDREYYRCVQSFFIRRAMKRFFTIFMGYYMMSEGDNVIPPTRVMAIIANFGFMARGWEQIDPTKDTKAEIDQLLARTTSLRRVAAKRGVALEELLEEISDDQELLKEFNLTQVLDSATADATTSSDDDEDDEDDEDDDA